MMFYLGKERKQAGKGGGRRKEEIREEGRKREKENKVREAIAESDVSFMI